MATELGGAQISSLMETLPGIAQVLRSPVADAIANLISQSSRHPDFRLSDAEEILRYAVRRNLMSEKESDQIVTDLKEVLLRKANQTASKAESKKAVVVKKAAKAPEKSAAKSAVKPKAAPKPKAKQVAAKAAATKTKSKAAAPKKKLPARKR